MTLKRERKLLWQKYKQSRNIFGRSSYIATLDLTNFLNMNFRYRTYAIQSRKSYEDFLVGNNSCPKLFYAYIRTKKSLKSNVGPFKVDGRTLTFPGDIAECLAKTFSAVYCTSDIGDCMPHQTTTCIMDDINFTIEKITTMVKR